MQNRLADKRQVILILRLTIDERGQLRQGEVVKLEGEVLGHFLDWSQFTQLIQTWVITQAKEDI